MQLPHLLRWLLVFIGGVGLTPDAMSEEKPPVTVELRTFIAHGDFDEWGRSTGLSCVLTNQSQKAVAAFEGYDGEKNSLIAETYNFPIQLGIWKGGKAVPIFIGPGESKVLYTLPLHGILRLGESDEDQDERAGERWGWGWAKLRPRGAPPPSPVHSHHGPGWQASIAPTATFHAEVFVDGQAVDSKPLLYKLPFPKPAGNAALSITSRDGTALIAGGDVAAYHWPSHALRLRKGVVEALQEKLAGKLASGAPFQVRVRGEVIYEGCFVSSLSSHSQSGVVIRLDAPEVGALELGYPRRRDFKGADPRADERVRKVLLESGILLQ